MLIQLANGLLAKIVSDGDCPEEATGRLFQSFPISAFRLKFPGGIRPDYSVEKKAGLTIGQVFGNFTLENVLDRYAEKIMAGQYRLKIMFSKDTGISASGTRSSSCICFGTALTPALLPNAYNRP